MKEADGRGPCPSRRPFASPPAHLPSDQPRSLEGRKVPAHGSPRNASSRPLPVGCGAISGRQGRRLCRSTPRHRRGGRTSLHAPAQDVHLTAQERRCLPPGLPGAKRRSRRAFPRRGQRAQDVARCRRGARPETTRRRRQLPRPRRLRAKAWQVWRNDDASLGAVARSLTRSAVEGDVKAPACPAGWVMQEARSPLVRISTPRPHARNNCPFQPHGEHSTRRFSDLDTDRRLVLSTTHALRGTAGGGPCTRWRPWRISHVGRAPLTRKQRRDDALQRRLYLVRGPAGSEAEAVAEAEDVGVHRDGRLAEGDVEDDVRRLPPDAGELLERLPVRRNLPAVLLHERLREGDDVLRLRVEEADGLDEVAHPLLAEVEHRLRRVGGGEEAARRLVDAGIGRLGGEDDGDEERERVGVLELRLRLGEGVRKAGEEGVGLGLRVARAPCRRLPRLLRSRLGLRPRRRIRALARRGRGVCRSPGLLRRCRPSLCGRRARGGVVAPLGRAGLSLRALCQTCRSP